MDKKSIIAIAVVGVIVVGLLIFLFIGDSTEKTVLSVGKVDYDIDDFISYVKAWEYDGTYTDFDSYMQTQSSKLDEVVQEKDYVSQMFSTYEIYKMYAQYADKLGVVLEEGEAPTLESGDAETLLSDYDITSGEYIRVQTEIAKANKFFSSPDQYISGDSSITDSYIANNRWDPEKVYTTYKYRVIQVPVEMVDEETNSGEFADNVSGENARRLAEAKEKSQALLDLSKEALTKYSGEIAFAEFQEYITSKENATLTNIFADVFASGDDGESHDIFGYIKLAVPYQRYSQNGLGFKSVENGDLDSVSALFASEDLTGDTSYAQMFTGTLYSQNIVPFIARAKEGEFSDLFTSSSSDYVGFAYLDGIENKLSEEDQKRFNTNVLNSYIQSSVELVTKNKAKIVNVKLADIIPLIARKEEEKRQQELANSGETLATVEEIAEPVEEVVETVEPIVSGE